MKKDSRSVLTGLDVLVRDGFAELQNHRVGLVTNHTGLDRDGRTTIDLLHAAPNVQLKCLFGPEHGIRGEVDEKVSDGTDAKTSLPVFSLYGERLKPTPEQLAELDTLVYDIQDVGCRFYTYISTLGHILEAASESSVGVVVLDRPNPITGRHVEGPMADADKLSFVAYHSLPVRHGMTVGELAWLFKIERRLTCDLSVVCCEGWKRTDWWDATGLPWTNPSPNMRSLTQATLYPGIGILEFTNLSVGRGTDTPFELVGAPFIDARAFAAALNAERLPGVRFIPIYFTPTARVHAGERCGGINLVVTNRDKLDAVQVGMTLTVVLRHLYPAAWEADRLLRLLVNQRAFDGLTGGKSPARIAAGWDDELEAFKAIRRKYLLYK